MRKRGLSGGRLHAMLRRHLRADPARLAVVEQHFDAYQRPNLHLALEEMLESRESSCVGVIVQEEYIAATLPKLSQRSTARQFEAGPVERIDVPLADGRALACVKRGLYLVRERGGPLAMLVHPDHYSHPPTILVEAMTPDRDRAQDFLRELAARTHAGKAHRGHVLSFEEDCRGTVTVKFHRLPPIARDQIILPEDLLKSVERHTLGFVRHADALRAAGRHIKRGLLLHGPPGTGKTLTAMYLATQMAGRTVVLLTGGSMGSIEPACRFARLMAPATVILEDVDLIGTMREHQTVGANQLLFELLNQMEGLAPDADVLFVLTTNRPDVLEPALASRPGRIDQAFHIPLPDADGRGRLLGLYSRGMRVELADREGLVKRIEGASGAFIRELLRKSALFAAEENGTGPLTVHDGHVDAALRELVVAGGALTQTLLGAKVS